MNDDIDKLLQEAGERWRASQRNPPDVHASAFGADPRRSSPASLLMAGAIGATLVVVIGVAGTRLGFGPGAGGQLPISPTGQAAPSGRPSLSATDGGSCAVTRPIPVFVPPSPFLPSPPAYYQSDWFGSAALWTMINHEGEIWKQSSLPHNSEGLTQKTFWWTADWPAGAEPEPAITVVGTRLDGTGTFASSPGTNASADFGTAMLVGVDFPSPGCWQLTGRYRDAVLSYVVQITDD